LAALILQCFSGVFIQVFAFRVCKLGIWYL
jgi:hypothetical protein